MNKLKQRQVLPLGAKVILSKRRIREWYEYYNGEVYVAFSGGKDSTVLLHLVRSLYPEVPAVFADTGLEYPEIRQFVHTFDNIVIVRPEMNFIDVLKTYGYPIVSKKVARMIRDLKNPTKNNKTSRNLYLTGIKRDGTKSNYYKLAKKWHKLIDAPFKVSEQCCNIMKKNPIKKYEKKSKRKAIIGTMTEDSSIRKMVYLNQGNCNNFKNGKSIPLSFWKQEDIWDYIKQNKLDYCSVYDTGIKHTGCMFCMFGVHLEGTPNRFQCMKKSHPKLHKYCLNFLGIKKVLDFIGVDY